MAGTKRVRRSGASSRDKPARDKPARDEPTRSGLTRRGAKARPPARVVASRTRLRADEARTRILEAAEQQLMRVGPEGLRLTELARTLGISHPAILHHFGSREGLVAAVVRHAMLGLNAQVLLALEQGGAQTAGDLVDRVGRVDKEALMDMVAEAYGKRGFARMSAWLLLSGRAQKVPRSADAPLRDLSLAAYERHKQRDPNVSYEDTLFAVQLVAVALLGDAIFGEAIRRASGVEESPDAPREFRRRLAQLLGGLT